MFNKLNTDEIDKCIALRKSLHQKPETAFEEKETAKQIKQFISPLKPQATISNIGGDGLIFTFEGNSKGKHLVFRAELDALPIEEVNEFAHRSTVAGKSHKCGHDGHMSILAALAVLLTKNDFDGKVSLLFQPAEETGEGALAMIKDQNWKAFAKQVDRAYALHNLPTYPLHEIILKKDVFAAASKGIIIRFKGKPSHAAHPNDGINPSLAVAQSIQSFYEIPSMHTPFGSAALITTVGIQSGDKAFGTSASEAELYATLRSFDNTTMENVSKTLIERLEGIAKTHHLQLETEWVETFPAVENDKEAVDLVKKSAESLALKTQNKNEPFSWSEDFGQFAQDFPICLFGLGSGLEQAQLHNNDYDFPDPLIETGANLFYQLIVEENKAKK
jgi:amidohydrolase